MTNKLLDENNGGFPPIKVIKNNKNKNNDFPSKDRGFNMNELKNVKIQDIIKVKKENIIKKKEEKLEIIDSL